jgi:Histidine kinase-, DNA gyrase B-, and HSP90-like ATPase
MNIPSGLPFHSSTALQKWLHSPAMRPFLRLVGSAKILRHLGYSFLEITLPLGAPKTAHFPCPTETSRLDDVFAVALDNALNHGHSERCLRIASAGEQVFRVFERLATTGEGTGTGIGLAILRRVAESTGGRAWIEETPGGGCCLLFELAAGETL